MIIITVQKHYVEYQAYVSTQVNILKLISFIHNKLIKIIITDSPVYFIQTDDFYDDIVKNTHLLDRMDTANLP